ncbi:uncharacterized protein LOC128113847 [Peromyscus californicus insignis]|uniref:uncharacterized protein LOC128113847 n=1 Tax=Peromyscus californicus insignis TaxID=564181 RepID=UPI0022A70818|nr:uncharacterized protein LOC128113847 [Peromyscus californicus insignis]
MRVLLSIKYESFCFPNFPCVPGLTISLFNLIFRFFSGKGYVFKLSALLSSLLALVFEIIIASSQCWRPWRFDNNILQFVSFGLWEAYSPQELNESGTVTKMLVHTTTDSTRTVSPEFQIAQTLIVWVILMKPVVLIFGVVAIKISCMKDPFVEMATYCYNVSASVLCVSSLFTLVSVSWNHFVDHYGQTTLDFPPYFPVNEEALITKYCTTVLPLGILTAAISLFSAVIFLSEISVLQLQSWKKAQRASIVTTQEA